MGCAGGTRIGNVCYKLVTEEMSWEDARQTCAAEKNGDLASIPEYAVQAVSSLHAQGLQGRALEGEMSAALGRSEGRGYPIQSFY